MTIFVRNPNNGYFGKNKTKKSDKSPDYTGSILLGDDVLAQLQEYKATGRPVMLYLSGWKKTPQGGGDPYISLACNTALPQQNAAPAPAYAPAAPKAKPAARQQNEDKDEDIPF